MSTGKARAPRAQRQKKAATTRKRVASEARKREGAVRTISLDANNLKNVISDWLAVPAVIVTRATPIYGLDTGATITLGHVKWLLVEARDSLEAEPGKALVYATQAVAYLAVFSFAHPLERLNEMRNLTR